VPKSDFRAPTIPDGYKGRTIWDETIAALTRALDRATDDATVLAIVSELRALRASK
jgi:hypothetical protein